MSNVEKTACVEFFCPVNEYSVKHLLDTVKLLRQEGFTRIKLLISSAGGTVFHGMTAHNFLKGIDIQVDTYNFGSVDSSAGMIYCAGATRYSVPHARFLIHPMTFILKGNFSEETLKEQMKNQTANQETIIKETVEEIQPKTTVSNRTVNEYGEIL